MREWQPISTAPDGVYLLVSCPNYGVNVALLTKHPTGDAWFFRDANWVAHPTHWMPLPAPPQAGGTP